ncbi:MAG: hypothetical protein JOZ62_06985, partial [Acidobacteriaceae bacterium]|nr:hypothetical protein [Acidobacteriaceae bacterium]
MKKLSFLAAAAVLALTVQSVSGAITIDTSSATDWKISNGVLSLDWNSTNGNVSGVHLAGYPDNLVDLTHSPRGLYMDNSGTFGSGARTADYYQDASYIDWWVTTASSSSNAFTYSQHFILADGDSGFHVYFVVNHASTDIDGSLGQIQYVFRISQTLFTNTYSADTGLNNLGPKLIPLPAPSVVGTTDPGRQVQDATVDLHGLQIPDGFGREFYTKYDYSTYEYLHRAHGLYGSTYGAWAVIPRTDSFVGGPTKQDLTFTFNILMIEALSDHLNNGASYSYPSGTDGTRLFGPYYFHFNTFGGNINTPDDMYADAVNAISSVDTLYDNDPVLLQNGYAPTTGRGTLSASVSGGEPWNPLSAWAVLSDDQKNFQYSGIGNQYWANAQSGQEMQLGDVVPGTYHFSAYVLGQWGELRRNGISVAGNQNT